LGESGEGALGAVHIRAAGGLAQLMTAAKIGREAGGLDQMEDLILSRALFLDAGGVAVEDLENRQGALGLGKFLGHLICRRRGHEGVVPRVVLPAEGAGVGEGARSDESAELRSLRELLGQEREEALLWCLLHEDDKWLEGAEGEGIGSGCGPGLRD